MDVMEQNIRSGKYLNTMQFGETPEQQEAFLFEDARLASVFMDDLLESRGLSENAVAELAAEAAYAKRKHHGYPGILKMFDELMDELMKELSK